MKLKITKRRLISIIEILAILLVSLVVFGNKAIAANTTGNTVIINKAPDSQKIGQFHTYRKSGVRTLDLYCAQKGGHIDSHNSYTYNEVVWDSDAGIWKSSNNSFEKITWIKNNFWEKTDASSSNKYTTAEKVEILQQADTSITESDVTAVFGNSNEMFKLYQMISWTYTNGSEAVNTSYISGSTLKIYNAIITLANNNYTNTSGNISIKETSQITQNSDGTFSWGVAVTNTCILPYTMTLNVDGNAYTNYTYSDGVIKVNGLSSGTHTFEVEVSTYVVSSTASVWKHSSKQNLIEITSTTKSKKSAALTTEGGTEGYYTLQINKVDESGKTANATFTVNENSYSTSNGKVTVAEKQEITDQNQVFEYTIKETAVDGELVKLKDSITIELVSGVKNGYYVIKNARFKANGENTIEAVIENGSTVILRLETSISGDTSTVTLTVPNKEKIYDLALTKTLIIPDETLIEMYDFNFDGVVDVIDSSLVQSVYAKVQTGKSVQDAIEETDSTAYNNYWKYLTADEAETVWTEMINEIGGMASASTSILSAYVNSQIGNDADRINYISTDNMVANGTATYNMNKTTMQVKSTDTLTYKITVYNEGDYDAKNVEVTDYLPEGLVACDAEGNTVTSGTVTCTYKGTEYVWTINGNEATITLDGTIEAYNGSSLDHIDVYITCKLDSVSQGTVLYNVAEISASTPIDDNGNEVDVEDRDSEENSLDDGDVVDDYTDRVEENVDDDSSDRIDKDTYDYEDDDDFERIVVVGAQFDLALRKSISKVGKSETTMEEVTVKADSNNEDEDQNTENRLPKLTSASVLQCKETGTASYFHAKEAVEIESDDYVEYTIRVYNEGGSSDYSGYASQITDYLPSGLEFYAVVDYDGSWITTQTSGKYVTTVNSIGGYEVTYDAENNKVVIDCVNTKELRTLNYLNRLIGLNESSIQSYYTIGSESTVNPYRYGYQEVKIICKASSTAEANKNLTNLAEITASVATKDGEVQEGVTEKDSTTGNIEISSTTDMENQKVNLDTYYKDREVDDVYNAYYAGLEDDDDFETVIITQIPEEPDTPEIHKGVKTVENQDSGYDAETEHEWVIQATVPNGISEYNKYVIVDEIDERLVFSGIEKVVVSILNGKTLVEGIDYEISYDENTQMLEIAFIESDFVAGKELTEGSIIQVTFKTTFAVDEDGNIIALNESVPNQAELVYDNGSGKEESTKSETPEVHTGAVAVYKYNEETGVALEGAKFKIATSEENAKNGEFVKDADGNDLVATSNSEGIAIFTGLSYGGDATDNKENLTVDSTTGASVYKYDWETAKTTYYVVETEAPEGFILNDTPVAVEVSKNTTLTEIKDMVSIANSSSPDTPEIHKGVKTVENQDSGYDAETEHEWVIQATVPNGISEYNKYVIVDEIDERLVFSGTEKVEVSILNGKTLAEGTDYEISYDEDTKTLKIAFIENDFVAGKELTAGSIIQVTFKTTFAVDEEGNIIALNESVPNQAELVYDNGSGTEESTKSETPEVHTGAVAVYKYNENTGVALEGAKFKIATTEENAKNGEFVKDADGNDLVATSNSKGIAIFAGLSYGGDATDNKENLTVDSTTGASVYKYDWETAKTTYYVVETEAPEGFILNATPVAVEVSKNTTLTEIKDMVSIANTPLIFDLSLRKWVTEAIVIENGQTVVTETGHKAEDDPESVVKVDLKKSKIDDVVVKFKYSIRVTNEGDIAGEATEIRDDIPAGLKFVQEDNPDWREENGEIVTDKLANTTLLPGESAEVEIILTWINSESNMGTMINTAEISQDHNEYGVPDIDSTPGNHAEGEDDIDDAPVMLTVKTGGTVIAMYVALVLGVCAIIGSGIVLIKKKVLA